MLTPNELHAITMRQEKCVDMIQSLSPMPDPTLDFQSLLKIISWYHVTGSLDYQHPEGFAMFLLHALFFL